MTASPIAVPGATNVAAPAGTSRPGEGGGGGSEKLTMFFFDGPPYRSFEDDRPSGSSWLTTDRPEMYFPMTTTYSPRYDEARIAAFARRVREDGFCVMPDQFPADVLDRWRASFEPLLEEHIEREGFRRNRGRGRYYVTLPFAAPFADPCIFEDDDVLAVVERVVGRKPVMCQLATDTPLLGSEYQEVHRDTPPLFPETGAETPAYQLAVNFPLVDVTLENGPVEIARGTHLLSKFEAMRRLEAGEVALEPVTMRLGDVMIRDVRGLHRGTPNRSRTPRPMVVIGYSRSWLFRPEVSIRVPRTVLDGLSDRARDLLRYNPVVDAAAEARAAEENYQSFAY
jgi:hypothetical protein